MGFLVKLLTPEGRVKQEEVERLHLPGKDGELEILAGHTPLIISLRAGVVRFHPEDRKNTEASDFFIWGGLANIRHEDVTLLVSQVCPLFELDPQEIEKRLNAIPPVKPEEVLLIQAQLEALERYS